MVYRYKIHYIHENNIIIILLSEGVEDKSAFAFLNEIKIQILSQYSIEELMNTNGLQLNEGKDILVKKMRFYGARPCTTTKGELIDNLNLAKGAVIENLETLIERNDKMELMVKKSDNLKDFSNNLSALTVDISKREYERKNRYVIVIFSLFLSGFIISTVFFISSLFI